jgi:hypothetical protein
LMRPREADARSLRTQSYNHRQMQLLLWLRKGIHTLTV